MKNLEIMGVQEMDAAEIKEFKGGGWLAYWAGFYLGSTMTAYAKANPVHTSKI